jgi:hypothetical protein
MKFSIAAAGYGPPSAPCYTYNELYNFQINLLNNYMYPYNILQAKAINSTYLAPDVLGRVDVTTTISGQELNTEYLYGLFANLAENPQAISLLGFPVSYTLTHFTARRNVVSYGVIIMFNFSSLGLAQPIEIDGWTVFNDQLQVQYYDITFRWFSYLYDTLFEIVGSKINAKTENDTITWLQTQLADGICQVHDKYCNGTNQQYSGYDECTSYLETQLRFGKAYELGENTLLCRMVHQNMVPLRPSVHCPHIGPTGGDMCKDDVNYMQRVLDTRFLAAPFIS